ncbi:unnamed protein product [Scytosiphon promiscuus]
MKRAAPHHKAVLSRCAGPILLAIAASATTSDDYMYPAPAPTNKKTEAPLEVFPESSFEMGDDSSSYVTPAPSAKATLPPTPETMGPTEYYVETTDGGEEEMENSEDGASCSTYDEDVHVANLLPETCEWNTYMCCWTGHDGPKGMYDTSDVCRVLDYPEEGDDLELPRDDEGPVYCHGFAWADDADMETQILPLYYYVTNVNRTEDGGYYGNVEGAPECGCIEEMPVVDNAACSMMGWDGIQPCWDNKLRSQYKYKLDEPKGEMEFNLVNECDNHDVPDYDFRTCEHNTYMCCWTENDGLGMADNTDVCRVIDYPEVGQTTEYPGDSEGEVHCHGFAWPEDATDKYIHLLAQFVQHFDHRDRRGYYGNIDGAPMCACVEDMPQVSEADCTTYNEDETNDNTYAACTNNDLRTRYEELYPTGELPNLVEECDNENTSSST